MADDAHLFDEIPLGAEALKRKVDALTLKRQAITLELQAAKSQLAAADAGGDLGESRASGPHYERFRGTVKEICKRDSGDLMPKVPLQTKSKLGIKNPVF